MQVCEIDLRPGGAWRFVQQAPDGATFAFRGEYHEIAPPERLVYTFEYEGMPGHVLVETLTFEEQDGRTKLTALDRFASAGARDAMLQSGMEQGAVESLDRLATHLQTMA